MVIRPAPETHVVTVTVKGGAVTYDKPSIRVNGGDTIVWRLDGPLPFGVVVKALDSPLDWASAVAPRPGLPLEARVRLDAAPGLYPYALCVCSGDMLVIDDPDFIIPPPRGRG